MATLYVSDLDFTLLRSDATLGARTVAVVNRLIATGHHFTCATARSPRSAMRVTSDLDLSFPLITYGGAVRFDPARRSIDSVESLPRSAIDAVVAATASHPRVEPVLFAMVDGRDRVCWRANHVTGYVESFVSRRSGDPRLLPLPDWEPLAEVPVFYATVIGNRDDIDALRRDLHPDLAECFDTVGPDGYNPQQTWLEIVSAHGTKAAAARALADQLRADRLIAFGDNLNDVPLFLAADYGYAVANAVPQLLSIADGVVLSNDDEGVADWLERNLFGAASV